MIEEKLNELVFLLMKLLKKSKKKNSNQYNFYISPIFWAEQKRIAKAIEDYDGSENKYIYNEYFLNSIYRISNLIKVINEEALEIIKEHEVIKNMLFVRNCLVHPEESYKNGYAPVFDMNYTESMLRGNSYFNSTNISISKDLYENKSKKTLDKKIIEKIKLIKKNETYSNSEKIYIINELLGNKNNEIKDNSKNSPGKKDYHMQSLHNVVSIKNVKNSFIESINIIIKSLKN